MTFETLKKAHEQYKDSDGDLRIIIGQKAWTTRTIEKTEEGLIKLTDKNENSFFTSEDKITGFIKFNMKIEGRDPLSMLASLLHQAAGK